MNTTDETRPIRNPRRGYKAPENWSLLLHIFSRKVFPFIVDLLLHKCATVGRKPFIATNFSWCRTDCLALRLLIKRFDLESMECFELEMEELLFMFIVSMAKAF